MKDNLLTVEDAAALSLVVLSWLALGLSSVLPSCEGGEEGLAGVDIATSSALQRKKQILELYGT